MRWLVLDYHTLPLPTACDVCRYVLEHGLDCAYEHARVRLATAWLVDDLADLDGRTAGLMSLAVSHLGVEPGPVHPIEPRQWFWAIAYEPNIRLSLRSPQ